LVWVLLFGGLVVWWTGGKRGYKLMKTYKVIILGLLILTLVSFLLLILFESIIYDFVAYSLLGITSINFIVWKIIESKRGTSK